MAIENMRTNDIERMKILEEEESLADEIDALEAQIAEFEPVDSDDERALSMLAMQLTEKKAQLAALRNPPAMDACGISEAAADDPDDLDPFCKCGFAWQSDWSEAKKAKGISLGKREMKLEGLVCPICGKYVQIGPPAFGIAVR